MRPPILTTALIGLLSLIAVLSPASPASAHGGAIVVRRTPFRPFVGPVPVRVRGAAFVAPHAFVAPFRYSYFAPVYSTPIIAPVYAPPVVAAPAITYGYSAPAYSYGNYVAPPVSIQQSYSSGYSYAYSAPAYTAPVVSAQSYTLPNGAIVLPDGRVIQ